MKKTLFLILAAALAFMAVACSEQLQEVAPTPQQTPVRLNKPVVIQDETCTITCNFSTTTTLLDVISQGTVVVGQAIVSDANDEAPVSDGSYGIAFVNVGKSVIETQLLNDQGDKVATLSKLTFPAGMQNVPEAPTPGCNLGTCVSTYLTNNGPTNQALANSTCTTIRVCILCACPSGNSYVMVAFQPNNLCPVIMTMLASQADLQLILPVAS